MQATVSAVPGLTVIQLTSGILFVIALAVLLIGCFYILSGLFGPRTPDPNPAAEVDEDLQLVYVFPKE